MDRVSRYERGGSPFKSGRGYVEIYVLSESGGPVRYVGCARNAEIRLRSHWRQRNSKYRTPLKEWLCGLSEQPTVGVLEVVPDELGLAAEEYYTKMLRQIDTVDLLNVLDAMKKREPMRRQIAESMKGREVSAQARQKISLAGRGRRARLTEGDVRFIRASQLSFRELASQFSVAKSTIQGVKDRKSWKYVE
jgi:hypothetical protein